MTVALVLRDRILADSRVNDENQPLTVGKIFKRRDGSLFVTAGDSRLTYPFERALIKGKQPEPVDSEDDEGFDGVLLTKKKEIIVYDKNFAPFPVSEPWVAIGSGYNVVRSWLKNGADPITAMRRAIQVDKDCGYPIQIAFLNGKTQTVNE